MLMIGQKYPILADVRKIKILHVKPPKELLSGAPDTHVFNKMPVKLEFVDWWVTNAPELTDEQRVCIDVLNEQPRKEVQSYFNYNWEEAVINVGPLETARKKVPTKMAAVRINPQLRTAALMNVLTPEHIIPYREVPMEALGKLKEIRDRSAQAKISISMMGRILFNQMETSVFSYAIAQSNFVVRNLKMIEHKEKTYNVISETVKTFSRCVYEHYTTYGRFEDPRKFGTYTLMGMSLLEHLKDDIIGEDVYTKFLKTICGFPIHMESEILGIKFSPIFTKIHVLTILTL